MASSFDVPKRLHAAQHGAGGSDPITPADIGAMGEAEMEAAAQAAAAPAVDAAQSAQADAASSATAAQQAAALVDTPAEAAVTAVTAGSMAAQSAFDALKATTDVVGFSVVTVDGRWRLTQEVSPNQKWSIDLVRRPTGQGDGPIRHPWLLDASALDVTAPATGDTISPTSWADEGHSSVTHTGTSDRWVVNPISHPSAYGGTYRYTTAPGESVTYTTPDATQNVYVRHPVYTWGGYGKVSIDGSATAATGLPTAQDEVTAGRLASTALVANGGALSPTDRLLNFYAPTVAYDKQTALVTALSPAVHTVRIDHTGYAQTGATDTRVTSSGYGSAALVPGGTPITTTHVLMPGYAGDPPAFYSAYEYALRIGELSASTFVGCIHGYDNLTGVKVWVDGIEVSTTTTASFNGCEVVVERTSELTSPHLTGKVADVTCRYSMTRDGLEVQTRIRLAQSANVMTGYMAMLPVADSLRVGHIIGTGVDLDLSAGTGLDAGGVHAKSQAAYARNPDTGAVAMMHLPDLSSVGNWAKSAGTNGLVWIEDRNYANKIYAARWSPSNPATLPAGAVLTGRTIYRARLMPSLAPALTV